MMGTALVLAFSSFAAVPRASAQTYTTRGFAEPAYVAVEAGASGAINDVPRTLWDPGGELGLAVYQSFIPELALGGRVRAGLLSEGGMVAQDPNDYGVLDYGLLAMSLRVRPFASLMNDNRRATGFYIDAGPGAAVLDGKIRFAYEAGTGYNFGIGPIAIGPMFRFTHFVETGGRFADNHVLMWTGGLEVAFLDGVRRQYAPPRAATHVRVAVETDRDGDGILDNQDRCPDQPEVFNGFEDEDGCPDQGRGEMINDALVVDERVFFNFDDDTLRTTGTVQLDAIAEHYRQYGDRYRHLIISGNTDERGTLGYNEDLSQRRAQAVRRYLNAHGVPNNVLEIEAWGETNPAVANATTEYDNQVNRRVEFRVQWLPGRRPEGRAPVARPTMPDSVDEAPRYVQARERQPRMRQREARERVIAARQLEQHRARIAERERQENEAVAATENPVERQPRASR
jgi:OOP family OmpA-OmpF porin